MTTISKYRDNAFGPRDFPTPADNDYLDAKDEILGFVDQEFESFDRQGYHDWVTNWKRLYLYTTLDIKMLKQNGDFKNVKRFQKLANTLLNARVFGKDVRRKVTNADVA